MDNYERETVIASIGRTTGQHTQRISELESEMRSLQNQIGALAEKLEAQAKLIDSLRRADSKDD